MSLTDTRFTDRSIKIKLNYMAVEKVFVLKEYALKNDKGFIDILAYSEIDDRGYALAKDKNGDFYLYTMNPKVENGKEVYTITKEKLNRGTVLVHRDEEIRYTLHLKEIGEIEFIDGHYVGRFSIPPHRRPSSERTSAI
jgi:hypothetical protein